MRTLVRMAAMCSAGALGVIAGASYATGAVIGPTVLAVAAAVVMVAASVGAHLEDAAIHRRLAELRAANRTLIRSLGAHRAAAARWRARCELVEAEHDMAMLDTRFGPTLASLRALPDTERST